MGKNIQKKLQMILPWRLKNKCRIVLHRVLKYFNKIKTLKKSCV